MRSYVAKQGHLLMIDAPRPRAGPGQIIVEVRAAGLNAADFGMMAGTYVPGSSVRAVNRDPMEAVSLGSEAAGTVVELGEGATRFNLGDRVMSVCQGAFSTFVAMHDAIAMPIPDSLSWAEAAAIPVTFTTAHDALTSAGQLCGGDNVLITAASSGVGVAALQLARLLGAEVICGSSRSAAKLEELTSNGMPLDLSLLAGESSFSERALDATDGHGFDVFIDNVGAEALADIVPCAALLARIVSVGRSGGAHAELDLEELARKRLTLIGVTFRTRSPIEILQAHQKAAADCLPAIHDRRLRPIVDRAFAFDELDAAQAWMRNGRSIGKVVIERS